MQQHGQPGPPHLHGLRGQPGGGLNEVDARRSASRMRAPPPVRLYALRLATLHRRGGGALDDVTVMRIRTISDSLEDLEELAAMVMEEGMRMALTQINALLPSPAASQ